MIRLAWLNLRLLVYGLRFFGLGFFRPCCNCRFRLHGRLFRFYFNGNRFLLPRLPDCARIQAHDKPHVAVLVKHTAQVPGNTIGLALVQGLPTSETELIIPYIVKNFVVSFNPVLAKILMVAFFIGASAVGLSTSNAFLSVASAIVADDLLRNTFHMDLSGKKGVNANRIIIAVLGIGSMLLALDPPELIFTLIMFSIAIVMPLFPVLVLSIYWKKATKQAAIVSSIVGTVLVLMTYFVWNIGGTWYGAIGMLGAAICMVAVSLFTKQDSKDSEAFFAALKNGMNRSYKIEDKAVAAQAGMSTED